MVTHLTHIEIIEVIILRYYSQLRVSVKYLYILLSSITDWWGLCECQVELWSKDSALFVAGSFSAWDVEH